MKQTMKDYTKDDHKIWQLLATTQMNNIPNKAATTYLNCLQQMKTVLNRQEIPEFKKITHWFKNYTGWSIKTVPGLIPPEEFFSLLAEKKFCSSTWLRNANQLDYLEEPDMFHDIFGHIPLLANPVFSAYLSKFGKIGVKNLAHKKKLIQLQRLYWFTIEFGVIQENEILKPYGAGILSSIEETNRIHRQEGVFHPFNVQKIINTDFHTDRLQEEYFVISSFKELFNSLSAFEY
ncbi:phenylalanine 4-monooxygenase [Mesonia aquimarina]|uniref:phenylalanine 4-monooxygenase n=1 Tax=Mesonia aquimarina TaxID=1504967 RepID=UPI000EF60D7A|nr:phenylalanine 4-monooxygenase [Mesonia aquimarina]